MLLVPFLGQDFFPSVDSGQITLHARTPPAPASRTPPRSWPRSSAKSAASSRARDLPTIVDNIGLNQSPTNMIYNNTGTVGLQDADIFITLNENHHPTADYVRTLRERLPRLFPG